MQQEITEDLNFILLLICLQRIFQKLKTLSLMGSGPTFVYGQQLFKGFLCSILTPLPCTTSFACKITHIEKSKQYKCLHRIFKP